MSQKSESDSSDDPESSKIELKFFLNLTQNATRPLGTWFQIFMKIVHQQVATQPSSCHPQSPSDTSSFNNIDSIIEAVIA